MQTEPRYNLHQRMSPASPELMTPPYPSMNVGAWRAAVDTYVRLNPGKQCFPYQILSIYKKNKS